MRRFPPFLLLLAVLQLGTSAEAKPLSASLPITSHQVDLSDAADLKRDEVISELLTLIERLEGEKKDELKFRLAETYWEKSRFAYDREYPVFDKAYQAWVDGGRKGNEPDLKNFTAKTRKFKDLAISQYENLIAAKTKYARLDEVLFMLAYLQLDDGKKGEATKNLQRLVREFPESHFLADAYLALGETAFNSNDLDEAEKDYGKAYTEGLKNERTSTYVFALYKLAWCDYNRKNFDKALHRFQDVVKLSEEAAARFAQGSSAQKDAVQLRKESLGDVVKAFAQVGDINAALNYFKEKSRKDDLSGLIVRLAHEFHDQGDSAKEIKTYESIIAFNPNDEAVPAYLGSILESQATLNNHDALVETAKLIAEKCKTANTSKACAKAEESLRSSVTNFHKFAQTDRYKKDYMIARALYESYLSAFTGYEDHPRLAFYFADLLWDIGELQAAAVAYEKVVALNHKGENALTSAMNAVRALDKVVHNEPAPAFIEGRLSQTAVAKTTAQKVNIVKGPLSEPEVDLVKACDVYVALVDEQGLTNKLTQEVMETRYKAAFLHQTHQLFDEANKRFGEIIALWPKSQMARDAALMILDGDDARKDWEQLSAHANAFAKNKELMQDEKLAKVVRKFQDGSAFNTIAAKESKAANTDKLPLAKSYEEFAESHGQSPLATSALFNALLIYRDNKADESVVSVGKKILDRKSEDPAVLPTTLLAVAKAEENQLRFPEAAKFYEQFATRYSDKKESADMLYNAGVLQQRSGNSDEAIRLFEKHLNTYKNSKDDAQILMSLAATYEQKQEKAKATAVFQRLLALSTDVTPQQRWHAYLELVQSDSKNCKDAIKAYDSVSKDLKQSPEVAKARAYCEFQLLKPEHDAFAKISMQVPASRLKKQIDAKKAAMEKLAKAYLNILSFGDDEWGIAALSKAAQTQLDYVAALRDIPDPKGLDAEALQIFRTELENIVAPVETDAIEALSKAQARAFDLRVYTAYTKDLTNTLVHSYPMKLSPFVWNFPLVTRVARSGETNVMSKMALDAYEKHNESQSRWAADQAIAAKADVGTMYELIGQWELSHDRMGAATAAFMKACEATPSRLNGCSNAAAIALSFSDFKNAALSFRAAKLANPTNPLWKTALGYAYAASGDTEKAISELTAALSPDYASKEGYASLCLLFRNQKADAKSALDWCGKYRSAQNGRLSDNDPMKPIISGLESEVKSDAKTHVKNGEVR